MDLTNLNQDRKSRRKSGSLELGTMMFGKVPPQAKDMEQSVLGACLLEKNAFDDISDILQPESFYVEAHQRIFTAMVCLKQKNSPIDLFTVVEELKYRQELDLVGGPYYVTSITNCFSSGANIETHARIVLQKFIQRELIRVAGEIIGDAYQDSADVFDLLDEAEEKIMCIGTKNVHSGMIGMDDVVIKTLQQIEKWRQNEGTLTGVSSGFQDLDRATRGWQPNDLILLAARPSVGKTAFALNIIRNAAHDKKEGTVAVWSLEMKAIYLGLRMMAAESNIWLHKIQTGRLTDQEMKHLQQVSAEKLSQLKIKFDDSSNINIRNISSKARRLHRKSKLKLIVIDYLQLMGSIEKANNREREIAIISRSLKNLAHELDIPIIVLSQLSREGVKAVTWDNPPPTSSLRESGSLEQDADVIILGWEATDQEKTQAPELEGKRRWRIAKQRNSVTITTDFDFKNEIQLFTAIDKLIPGNYKPYKQAEADQAKLFIEKGSRMNDDPDDETPF